MCTPAVIEPIVVWLGYQGGYVPQVVAGQVKFMNANWYVPNARPGGRDFPHRDELAEIIRGGVFNVADRLDEKSDVDFLVRVDLGETSAAGAVGRAADIVNVLFSVSVHHSNGIRPHLAQSSVVRSGKTGWSNFMVSRRDPGFPDDHYGARMTAEALETHAPGIADALARAELPRFLAAALEAQTAADQPFSREVALHTPSEADIRSVLPLTDRVVQHIAAHAGMDPNDLFTQLTQRWANARWMADVDTAVRLCLLGGGPDHARIDELRGALYNSDERSPWLLFAADNEQELLGLCRIESERTWIARMLRSVSDITPYHELITTYTAEAEVLEARRRRVRNALVHGNPVTFAIVESVREFAEFLSTTALHRALEGFVTGDPPQAALARKTAERAALEAGTAAADYWRARVAALPA